MSEVYGINFKFQSDSINTHLIVTTYFMHQPLNSNLILLIRILDILNICTNLVFKFQSDSINTEIGPTLEVGEFGL